jgi:hypothetical protein
MAEAFVKERFGVTSAAKEWLASEEAKNLQAFLYKVSEYLESKGIIDNPFLKQRYTLDGMASILS